MKQIFARRGEVSTAISRRVVRRSGEGRGLQQALQAPIRSDRLGQHYLQAGESPAPFHVREKTGRDHRAHVLQKLDPRPLEILDRNGQLYAVEEQARSRGLTAEERLALRQEQSRPLFEELGRRIREVRAESDVLPSCQPGKAYLIHAPVSHPALVPNVRRAPFCR